MASDILLENGTNELEILEFRVGGNDYGINVAKVEEIISDCEIQTVPNSRPFVEGLFRSLCLPFKFTTDKFIQQPVKIIITVIGGSKYLVVLHAHHLVLIIVVYSSILHNYQYLD